MLADFSDVFRTALGHSPYPWQIRLTTENELPDIIDVETGLGKTAAVIIGWLYRRRFAPEGIRAMTPRRLVFCLPTRVLVEQTRDTAQSILTNLAIDEDSASSFEDVDPVLLKVLWGGDVDNDIDYHPDKDMIIIGTQDMLLSRALNRGYAMSKFRWPTHFSILNNDCLWIMDEVQLMGVGASTSAQLAAFRSILGTIGPQKSIWMSATMDRSSISTIDHPLSSDDRRALTLGEEDLSIRRVNNIIDAAKVIRRSPIVRSKQDKNSDLQLASRLVEMHEEGTLTIAIFNTVSRASSVFSLLQKADLKTPIVLLHSHFRPGDRAAHYAQICEGKDLIVISTQVIEAGADISAKNMITDLAPWPSMVQRFGRCNRRGEYPEATIEWIDPGEGLDETFALPYSLDELSISREIMLSLECGSPRSVSNVIYEPPARVVPIIRKKDILELFDTTPDLLGNDLDISRFVRSDDSTDVFVYWRDLGDHPPTEISPPSHDEICGVPIAGMRAFLKDNDSWVWDYVEGRWSQVSGPMARQLRPGMLLLLDQAQGGYSDIMGWTGSKKDRPSIIEQDDGRIMDSHLKDTYLGYDWVRLSDHTDHVIIEARELASLCNARYGSAIIEAARWHDVGKAHEAFQNAFSQDDAPYEEVWGKGPMGSKAQYHTTDAEGKRYPRPYFRHELASALAHMHQAGRGQDKDLVTYLIAAHHGKVRMSLRSVPSERGPEGDKLFARGIWEGDVIRYPDMFDEEISLDLSPLRMGRSSWTSMVLDLRDDPSMGPFRLSFLETLMRVADWRASEKEGGE